MVQASPGTVRPYPKNNPSKELEALSSIPSPTAKKKTKKKE
jgi:hypothetical protein